MSIAKACSRQAKVLILDEPTASLDEKGKNILFDLIRRTTKRGLSIIYISHNLGEIFEIADRVTVFKDGRKVATHQVAEVSMSAVIQEMIGRASASLYTRERRGGGGRDGEALEVIDYSREGVVDHVSFQVREGGDLRHRRPGRRGAHGAGPHDLRPGPEGLRAAGLRRAGHHPHHPLRRHPQGHRLPHRGPQGERAGAGPAGLRERQPGPLRQEPAPADEPGRGSAARRATSPGSWTSRPPRSPSG